MGVVRINLGLDLNLYLKGFLERVVGLVIFWFFFF